MNCASGWGPLAASRVGCLPATAFKFEIINFVEKLNSCSWAHSSKRKHQGVTAWIMDPAGVSIHTQTQQGIQGGGWVVLANRLFSLRK